jgi:hypothetical protein
MKSLKTLLVNLFEDLVHSLKTGESTIRLPSGGKVFIDRWGGTRINPSETFRRIGDKKPKLSQ